MFVYTNSDVYLTLRFKFFEIFIKIYVNLLHIHDSKVNNVVDDQ